ncbi:hypothetical protein F4678DRAFT_470862 [Xylaria arbuscula]|nr:hypothetical protein F4678DRAFT_470862 [Xylaria arbuscula]
MTPSSLANLDLVSRHPSISRGVRIIRLFLGPFYTSSLAHGIQDFAVHHIAKLNESINRWENEIQWQTPDDPTEPYEKAISEAEHFIESWEQMAADDINENNADHLMLLQAHRKYLELYEDYRKLSCSLPQAITSAMLRMPAAKLISINKENIWGVLGAVGILRPRDFDQPESLLNYLVSPMSWYEAREHDIGPPPFHLIGELLFSIQQLGIPLAGLNIATPPPVPSPSTTNTAATMRELTVLRDVVKRLKIFTFYPRPNIWDEFWTRRPPDEWAHLTSLLRVLLHTSSLERIHLSFYFMGTDKLPPLLSMGSLLLSNTWPNLKDLCFSGPFHFEELKAVVKPLDRSVRLEWSGYLMSGSWADVLEFLQGRNAHEQVLGDVNGSIYGQECLNMNEAEKQFIFHYKMSDIPGMSMATQYIQGFLPSNPVVAWERGELDVPDLTDEDSDE